MKNIRLYLAAAAVAVLAAACSEEQFETEGTGRLVLGTTVSSDMEVVSRATDTELAENCMVWISSSKGLVRRYDRLADVPAEIDLVTGHYVAEAWTGDSVAASFEKRWFKGREEFDIERGATAQVTVDCRIANVAASVSYAEGISEVLTDITMTVGHKGGSLEFVGTDEDRRGYFMMPSYDKDLAFELRGTQIDGKEFVYNGVIENARPATEYVLTVGYTPVTAEVGGAMFSIEIDERTIEVHSTIEVIAAPLIEGYGFDIAEPVMAERGTVGRRSVYISSATKVTSVELSGDILASIDVLGGSNADLLTMNQTGVDALAAAGINFTYTYDAEADNTLMQINFEEELTNSLADGDHAVDIKATDVKGKTSQATLTFMISDAAVMTAAVADVAARTAVLRGTVAKAGLTDLGFRWRARGEAEWQTVTVEGTFASGDSFSTALSGLTPATTYEYVAFAGAFTSPIVISFTTDDIPQLPNASFEEWCTSDKAVVPGSTYAGTFWDSGNWGSATMSKNITDKSTTYKHSGTYSAMLKSQFVGLFGIGKFAAGNIFAGNYLYTDGMDGELGWGRPFSGRPLKVRAWVRYEPGTVVSGKDKGSGDHLAVGDTDQGIIYAALVDDMTTDYNTSGSNFAGTKWPCVVKTKSGQLFDENGSNVIAYGRRILDATTGAGMELIEFDLDYHRPGVKPTYIIFVASASRYGDYFEGGEGSTLYLDDIELVYE